MPALLPASADAQDINCQRVAVYTMTLLQTTDLRGESHPHAQQIMIVPDALHHPVPLRATGIKIPNATLVQMPDVGTPRGEGPTGHSHGASISLRSMGSSAVGSATIWSRNPRLGHTPISHHASTSHRHYKQTSNSEKLAAPSGVPRQSPTLVLTRPCAT